MIQFFKGMETGELEAVGQLAPDFHIIRFGVETEKFFWELSDEEKARLKR